MLRKSTGFLATAAVIGMIGTMACSRSDPGLTTEVKSKLVVDDVVKAYEIDVDTKDRIVTLSGTVETPEAREQAVTLARETEGVRDVVDHIAVDSRAASGLSEEIGEVGRESAETARRAVDSTGQTADRAGAVLTDAAVTSAVKAKLLADPAVSGLAIDVDTTDHVVTLSGTVTNRGEATRALSLARDSSGVKSVIDKLRVSR
jgi:hyperosmotically inducible periplasmic protein